MNIPTFMWFGINAFNKKIRILFKFNINTLEHPSKLTAKELKNISKFTIIDQDQKPENYYVKPTQTQPDVWMGLGNHF